MMRALTRTLVTAGIGLLVASGMSVAGESAPILHDPFEQPRLLESAPTPSTPVPADVPEVSIAWSRKLRATAVAGPHSLVNVDGIILTLGEQLDGFTLVEVKERAARFEKGEAHRTLTMTD